MIPLLENVLTNVGIFCFGILLLSLPIARVLDVWLLNSQQRRLREKFEAWWITVADFNKLELALVIAKKFSIALDKFFGERLFSSRAFFKGLLVATGLLTSSLALTGLVNHKPFGVQPWADYRQTALLINESSTNLLAHFQFSTSPTNASQLSVTNAPGPRTNSELSANRGVPSNDLPEAPPGHSIVATQSNRLTLTNVPVVSAAPMTTVTNSQPEFQKAALQKEIIEGLEGLVQITNKYNTTGWVTFYSIVFLTILVLSNALLFYISLTFSRLILREIIAAARFFSAVAFLVTNFCFVLSVSTVFLLVLSILGIPLVWYFMPLVYKLSQQSFGMLFLILGGGGIAAWIFVSPALKIVALIAILPCFFTLAVTFVTGFAIAARNVLHKIVTAVLLRFAENGFLKITITCGASIVALIAAVAELVHLFRFK